MVRKFWSKSVLKRDLVIDIGTAGGCGCGGRAGVTEITTLFVGAAAFTSAIEHGQLAPVALQHHFRRVFFNA